MNTPTPTPRTDAAWAKTFEDDDDQCRAGNAATDMRDECAKIERELAALTAERDELRDDRANEIAWAKWASHHLADAIEVKAERDQLRTENSTLRAGQKACEACDEPTAFEVRQFRAEMERLRSDRDCEKRLRKDAEEFRENAIARAERAEAEIIRLRTENSDLKATDTRPLLTGTLTHAGFCRIGEEQLDGVFISIDREQIKALRHLPMYQQIELRMAAMKEGAK